MNLVSERLNIDDYEEAVELFYSRGWTDELPVVLPTPRRVEALIAHVGRDPQAEPGRGPAQGGGAATIEKLAINAVMGAAWPEHFPVVLAALEALLDPEHNLNGVSQTTHMCVSLVIVNGPSPARSASTRATACSATAIAPMPRWGAGAAGPLEPGRRHPVGHRYKATLSHPGEYAFCIAEEEEDNPWTPLRGSRLPAGLGRGHRLCLRGTA